MADWAYNPGPRYRTGRDALTDSEITLLLNHCTDLEDYTLLSLGIATGMRREDIVNVEQKDIREIQVPEVSGPVLEVRYWEHKRNRTWRGYVAGQAAQTILQLMNANRGHRWLFASPWNPKKHLSSKTAYNTFQRWLKKAKLKPRPFHSLRATCIKQCQRKGWSIEQTMELVGDSWRTIQEHYMTPSEDELQETAISKPLIGQPLPRNRLAKLVAETAEERT